MPHCRIFAYHMACIALLLTCAQAGEPAEATQPASLKAILQALPASAEDPVWEAGERLVALGTQAKADLEAQLPKASPAAVLACSYALLRLGHQRAAVGALQKLLLNTEAPLPRRREAAALLVEQGGALGIARMRTLLGNQIDTTSSPMPEILQVVGARSLLKMTNNPTDFRRLQHIMHEGKSTRARAEAVLALAETGHFTEVNDQLLRLADVPGDLGARAAVLLQLRREQDKLAKSDKLPGYLINEVMLDIRKFYAPDETDKDEQRQLDPKTMASVAARAVLNSIDPFSDYLTEDDWKDMIQSLHSNYGGIGAWVGMRDGRFTILTPMFGKPAYRAGLRSMDVVDKINGKNIKDMRLNDIIKLLKGPADTNVLVTVHRMGWTKPKDFNITRDTIDIPSVLAQKLPGNVGYVRLNSFAEGDPEKGVKGTDELLRETVEQFKKDKVRGVVLDLTNNPGGLLLVAVNVARIFLGDGKLIVSKRGKTKLRGQGAFFAGHGEPPYSGPLVVLINQGSASASEIVSGALKDHGRAKLVGEKTFGKGSIQQPIPAWTTGGHIKLTVGYYYLPSGKCIHGPYRDDGGIKPHVEVKEPEISVSEFDVRWKIRDSHIIEKWLEKEFPKHEKAYRDLLVFDKFSSASYPDFEQVYQLLREKHPDAGLTKEIVRKELRHGLISYLHHNRGERIHVDPEENVILQRGLLVLGEEMPGGLPDIPLYNALREQHEEELKKLAAAKTPTPEAEKQAEVK